MPSGDHDVIVHLSLYTVQDLPIQEERSDSNSLIETFKAADLHVGASFGSLSSSLSES